MLRPSYNRVAITGVGAVSPYGLGREALISGVFDGKSSITQVSDFQTKYKLRTALASIVPDFDVSQIPRKYRRSMSRVSQMAVIATKEAIQMSELSESEVSSERTGVSYSSTMGGSSAMEQYFRSSIINPNGSDESVVYSNTFLQIMSHTTAANIALAFAIPGRVISSCTACSASTQSIGLGYEAIKYGLADRMICGGAEEYHVAIVGVFDTIMATSVKYNEKPNMAPRPFAADRDGIVVGEGAGTFILENWDLAKKRGANILGEIVGFATNSDSNHMTNPSAEGMMKVMLGCLQDAQVPKEDIYYINAHATATEVGDIAESQAVERLFGPSTKISSQKGHMGHLMGACGVLESLLCLEMLNKGCVIPTLNLENVDERCANIDYVKYSVQECKMKYILKNSFAFGGINASLLFKEV